MGELGGIRCNSAWERDLVLSHRPPREYVRPTRLLLRSFLPPPLLALAAPADSVPTRCELSRLSREFRPRMCSCCRITGLAGLVTQGLTWPAFLAPVPAAGSTVARDPSSPPVIHPSAPFSNAVPHGIQGQIFLQNSFNGPQKLLG